jgi:hypothetical protein
VEVAMLTAKPVDDIDFASVRKEVRDFVQAAERLLPPVQFGEELTSEECDLITEYVMMLSNAKNPWSRGLPIKYT